MLILFVAQDSILVLYISQLRKLGYKLVITFYTTSTSRKFHKKPYNTIKCNQILPLEYVFLQWKNIEPMRMFVLWKIDLMIYYCCKMVRGVYNILCNI